MAHPILNTLSYLAVGIYASAMLTIVGALSLITLSGFGAIPVPF